MIDKTKILLFVKEKGPLLPRDVSKVFGGDTFLTGAILSQMVASKEIKISCAKIGSSPVYYVQGQEEKLSALFQYLPSKEKEAYTLLKEKKLIRDSGAEPAIRVAQRNIKDFAKALEVNISGNKEIFWKWYLMPNQDAERIIKEFFLPKKQEPPTEEQRKAKEWEVKKEPEVLREEPKKDPLKQSIEKPKEKKEEKQQFLEKEKQEPKSKEKEPELLQQVKEIFTKKEIEIFEIDVIKKKTELEISVGIPSPVGKLKYFCKVVDKKKTNDKDLSSVFVQSQMKKLPALYVTTGELTKKAQEMLEKEFKIISVMYI
jgi:hypothetical protein